ncbi:MAG TPA: hypothetical protein VNH11_07295 [Pirellulales bacterium]|nr:hypothetical protein [Pirellulales bacterium]
MPHGVNVYGSATLIALGNAGHSQVAVENLDQLFRHGEQHGVGRQLAATRYASHRQTQRPIRSARIAAMALFQFLDPQGQVGGKVASEGQRRAGPVLLVGRVEHDRRQRPVEVKLADRQAGQFAAA